MEPLSPKQLSQLAIELVGVRRRRIAVIAAALGALILLGTLFVGFVDPRAPLESLDGESSDNVIHPPPTEPAPGTEDEIRLRRWQADRMCTFIPLELVDEGTTAEAAAALRAWGNHRTFAAVFHDTMLVHAKRTHAVLVAAARRDPAVRRNADAWVEAARRLAGKSVAAADGVGDGGVFVNVSDSVVPPALLLVPPEVPRPRATFARPRAYQHPTTHFHFVARISAAVAAQPPPRPLWKLRDPRDAVVVFNESSETMRGMVGALLEHHPLWDSQRWRGKEGKSLLMWDHITRHLDWRGFADGVTATGTVNASDPFAWGTGFRECAWIMKADTDTFLNRPALRDHEMLDQHRLGWEQATRVIDPLRDPAYLGLPMGFSNEALFMFGGTGYYFTRAALELFASQNATAVVTDDLRPEYRGNLTVSFRNCPRIIAEAGVRVTLIYEDAMVGQCITVLKKFGGAAFASGRPSEQHLHAHRASIGHYANMFDTLLSSRHQCICCMRSFHKVGPKGHALLAQLMRDHCHAPRSASSRMPLTQLAMPQGDAMAPRTMELCVAPERRQCFVHALGNDPIEFKHLGLPNPHPLPPDPPVAPS